MAEPLAKKYKIDDEIKRIIHCCICKILITEKIYQCGSSHLYCECCINTRDECKYCSLHLYKRVRPLYLEELRDKIEIICENNGCGVNIIEHKGHRQQCKFNYCKNEGCEYHGSLVELGSHRQFCKYRKIICPSAGCNKTIQLSDLKTHITTEHKWPIGNIGKEIHKIHVPKKDGTFIACFVLGDGIIVYKTTRHETQLNIVVKSMLTEPHTLSTFIKCGEFIRGTCKKFPRMGDEFVEVAKHLGIENFDHTEIIATLGI